MWLSIICSNKLFIYIIVQIAHICASQPCRSLVFFMFQGHTVIVLLLLCQELIQEAGIALTLSSSRLRPAAGLLEDGTFTY